MMAGGISVMGLIVLFALVGGGVMVFAKLFGGSRSSGQDSSMQAAHGMTLKCPSCGSETEADRANCTKCGAEL